MAELCTQRDLNCLSEPDRSMRKGTLEKILKGVQSRAGKPDFTADLVRQNLEVLHKPLLKCVKDPAEKCRELSVTILVALLPLAASKDVEAIAGETLGAICERIGVTPQAEESEEVRLELLRLTKVVLVALPSSVRQHIDPVASILEKSTYDKFPDVKKLASELIIWLSAQDEGVDLKEYCGALSKALLSNLTHQQQKIRLSALQAIGAIVPLNVTVLKETLPCIARLNVDRAHQLREEVLEVTARWLKMGVLEARDTANVLAILLHGAADELSQVQLTTVRLMEEVGQARSSHYHHTEHTTDTHEPQSPDAGDADDDGRQPGHAHAARLGGLYPAAFTMRPCAGARVLVSQCLECLVRQLLAELGDWSAGTRLKAAATLVNVLVYAEEKIGVLAEPLLAGLCKACMDDEHEVQVRSSKAMRLAGAFIDASVFIAIVDANVRSHNASVATNKAWLAVLGTLVEGSKRDLLVPHLPTLCAILGDMELSLPEGEEYQVHLLRLVRAIVSTAGSACASEGVRRRLLLCLLRLQSFTVTCPAVAEKANEAVEELAQACLVGGEGELLRVEALPLLQQLCSNAAEWRRDSQHLYAFSTLMRRGAAAVAPHLSLCVPVFGLAADPHRDADVRSSLLLLLDLLLREEEAHSALRSHGQTLLADTVVPVCVWRAGKVAAALRKASVSCLHRLLEFHLVSGEEVMACLGKGFEPGPLEPVLKSCLDDDDADVRFMTCSLLAELMRAVEGRLDDEQVRNWYIELLKRMDDSNDRIRIECASVFERFLASMPRKYDSAQFDYLVRGLVVHLDDQNRQVQEAVLPAVLAAAAVNPTQLMNIVKECRSKHREATYCDEAIARAAQLAKHAPGDL